MATVSLASAIDASFINRFAGAAPSGSSGGALGSSSSSSKSIAQGLRYGAQIYGTAVQALNATISITNVSRSALIALGKITDQMISLAQTASDASVGESTRNSLEVQMQKLVSKFRDAVDSARIGDSNVLTSNGLQQIFTNIGLDPKTSESIAAIFKAFTLADGDTALASEAEKAQRPVDIPASAYTGKSAKTKYVLQKVSGAEVNGQQGGISTVNNVYNSVDTVVNQNPGIASSIQLSVTGAVTGMTAGTLTSGVSTLAVNESSGYSVVSSTDNLIGDYNPSNYAQLFLLDNQGTVVQQITNNSDAALSYVAADISSDNLKIAYSSDNSGTRTLSLTTISSLGSDPASLTTQDYDSSGAGAHQAVKISNDGSNVASLSSNGDANIYDALSGTPDTNLLGTTVQNLGFVEDDRIVYLTSTGDIAEYQAGSGTSTVLQSGLSINDQSHFSVLQSRGGDGFYSYIGSDDKLYVYDRTGVGASTLASSTALGTAASSAAVGVSMAFRSTGQAEVGLVGTIPGPSSDSTNQMYRLKWNPLSASGRRIYLNSIDPEDMLDESITTRPDAYRMLADLKAMREQIDKNVRALENAQKTIQKNVVLVRETGLAMLDLSGTVKSDADAQAVADQLQAAVRSKAPGVLNQLENLTSIAAAAISLASGETSLTA